VDFFGVDFVQSIHYRVYLEQITVIMVVMLVLTKMALILTNPPRGRHPNCIIDFIVRSHWFFIGSTFFAHHALFRYGDAVAELTGLKPPYLQTTVYNAINLALLVQVFIVTFLRQFEGAVAHYEVAGQYEIDETRPAKTKKD